MIQVIENKYDGVIIDNSTLPKSIDDFENEIEQLISTLQNKKLVWIKLSIEQSEFIPIVTKLNFEFHNCGNNYVMLVKKLQANSYIPNGKNFIVGVGAIVYNEGKLLVIKDKFSKGYKLPGGHIDANESITNALIREVYEETGIQIEFESIMNVGHFMNGQFGESNIYLACTAKAITTTICIHDFSEIIEATWLDIDEFLNSDDVHNYNRLIVKAAIDNTQLKLTRQHIQLNLPDSEVFF